MKNKIINNPTVEDSLALFSDFECGDNDVIALSAEDFIRTISDASKAIALESSASGPERLKVALSKIKDIVKDVIKEVTPNLNLFTADKALCLVVISEDFNIKEMSYLTEFFKNFNNETEIIWGVTKKNSNDDHEVTTRLLLSFK